MPTWLRPLVAPREARLGDALAMKIKTAPVIVRMIVLDATSFDTSHDRNANRKKDIG